MPRHLPPPSHSRKIQFPFDLWFRIFLHAARLNLVARAKNIDGRVRLVEHHKRLETADFFEHNYPLYSQEFTAWLLEARLVCKDFNVICIPYIYTEVKYGIGKGFKEPHSPVEDIIKKNVYRHSRTVQVPYTCKPKDYAIRDEVLTNCIRLREIKLLNPRLSATNQHTEKMTSHESIKYLHAFLQNSTRCLIRTFTNLPPEDTFIKITELPPTWTPVPLSQKYVIDAINPFPPPQLPHQYLGRQASSPIRLLVVDLAVSKYNYFCPTNLQHIRFPPMKTLILRSGYQWDKRFRFVPQNASPSSFDPGPLSEFLRLWDFSALTSLTLHNVDFGSFFFDVLEDDEDALNGLKELKLYGYKNHGVNTQETRLSINNILYHTFQSCSRLECFELDWWQWYSVFLFPDSILAGSGKLKKLSLVCESGRCGMDTIDSEELEIVAGHCKGLRELAVDLPYWPYSYRQHHGYTNRDSGPWDVQDFLKELMKMEKLETLHLVADLGLGTGMRKREQDPNTDWDWEDALKIFWDLRQGKVGTPFGKISILLTNAWRSEAFVDKPTTYNNAWCGKRQFASVMEENGDMKPWVEFGGWPWGTSRYQAEGNENEEGGENDE